MIPRLFEHTSAGWAKYSDYEWRTAADGQEYLMPAAKAEADVYNPMAQADELIVEAVNIGLLQFHKALMILHFLFFLVLFKVDRAKNQIGNTQQKRREFYCNIIPGIQQLRVYGGSIVEDIVGYRHDSKGNKGGCRLGQKLCDR